MAHREYLARYLELAGAELPRSAKPALNLSRFEDSPVELRLLLTQCRQLFFEGKDFFRISVRTGIRLLPCLFTSERDACCQCFWICTLPHLVHVQRASACLKN